MRAAQATRTDDQLGRYLRELVRIFKTAPTKREAHAWSRPVLEDIAADQTFLTGILRHYLLTPGVLNAKNYPVVGINIELNPSYHLVANCWIPLPGGRTNLSSKAIHHHGNMYLTTLTLFGVGYDHWLFSSPTELDPDRELYAMDVTEHRHHGLHDIAFVDVWEPHLPMVPERLTVTLCLWSSRDATTWRDYVKRVPLLKRHETALRRLAVRLGLSERMELKIVKYFDFFPTPEGFKGMKDRVEFGLGPNEDHLHSVFHALQGTGNEALAPLVEEQLVAGQGVANPRLVQRLVRDLRRGRTIEGRLSACHLGVPHATFTAQEIEQTIAALKGQASAAAAGAPRAGHR